MMIGNESNSHASLFEQLVFQGKIFSIASRIAVGASAVVNLVVDPTSLAAEDQLLFAPLVFKAFGAGPINIDIYFGGDIDADGTLISSFNRNTESDNIADTVVRLNPTVNTTGTKLPIEFVIFSDGTPAIATIGGEVADNLPFISRKDGKYLIRLTNLEAAAASAWAGFNWAELKAGG